jgi:hypothetical protein
MAITPVRGVAEGKALVTITMAEKEGRTVVSWRIVESGLRCIGPAAISCGNRDRIIKRVVADRLIWA